MLQSHLHVEVRAVGQGTVLVLSGELDVASTPALEEALAGVPTADPIIVDLRGLEFIDSTGLGALVRMYQQAEEEHREFALVKGVGQVDRLLGLTGLADRLPVAETYEELLSGS